MLRNLAVPFKGEYDLADFMVSVPEGIAMTEVHETLGWFYSIVRWLAKSARCLRVCRYGMRARGLCNDRGWFYGIVCWLAKPAWFPCRGGDAWLQRTSLWRGYATAQRGTSLLSVGGRASAGTSRRRASRAARMREHDSLPDDDAPATTPFNTNAVRLKSLLKDRNNWFSTCVCCLGLTTLKIEIEKQKNYWISNM